MEETPSTPMTFVDDPVITHDDDLVWEFHLDHSYRV
jgi:hypothetical protein